MAKGIEIQPGAKLRDALSPLIGGVAALLTAMALLLGGSMMISAGIFSENWSLQLVVASCVVGSFAGGKAAISRVGCRKLIMGVSAGAVMCMLLMIGNGIFFDGIFERAGEAAAVISGCLCGGILSGLGGKKGKKKRKAGKRSN